jgi:hypothetical protein
VTIRDDLALEAVVAAAHFPWSEPMKCFFHTPTDATATCQTCGRGLCAPCTARFTLVLCEACLLQHNQALARNHVKRLALSVALYVAGVTLFCVALRGAPVSTAQAGQAIVIGALLFPVAYWGWQFLSRKLPQAILIMPIPFWVVFGGVRLLLATAIGLIAAPLGITASIRELVRIRRTARDVELRLI